MITLKHTLSAVLFLTILSVTPSQAADEKPGTISVSGSGSVSVEPDIALISFGIVREGKDARSALDANNEAMGAVLKSMQNEGIAEKDIQTSQFSIQPQYFYPKPTKNGAQEPPRITGYTVSNNVSVRIRDLTLTGKILDQVVSLGVNSGGNIDFMNDDTKGILRIARENAVKDAIAKAQTLASAVGVKLGRILSITEGSHQPRPRGFANAQSSRVLAAEAVVPIASGEETYRVDVQVNWEIDQ